MPRCTNGDVRLVGGQSSREGRVEYCYFGEWSQICSDFQMEEAIVTCKQLGFTNPPGKPRNFCMIVDTEITTDMWYIFWMHECLVNQVNIWSASFVNPVILWQCHIHPEIAIDDESISTWLVAKPWALMIKFTRKSLLCMYAYLGNINFR